MYVANIDLCRELYELSGWETESWLSASDLLPEVIDGKKTGRYKRQQVPAYDLGFLLRKLPEATHIARFTDTYQALYVVRGIPQEECRADTPEDAACKLAIELFKHGVLK